MNLTNKQWLAIVMVILGVCTTSTAQMTELFGASAAKYVISLAGLVNTILAGVTAIISGQSSLVRDVAAMPGVERITVNEKANQSLAQVAVDPLANKIAPTNAAMDAVEATAKGA